MKVQLKPVDEILEDILEYKQLVINQFVGEVGEQLNKEVNFSGASYS